MRGPPGASPDWHHASAYSWLTGADRASLMWEWLRCDESYVAWHIRATAATGGDVLPTAAEPRHWRVHFRGRPCHLRPHRPDHLARLQDLGGAVHRPGDGCGAFAWRPDFSATGGHDQLEGCRGRHRRGLHHARRDAVDRAFDSARGDGADPEHRSLHE